MSITPIITIAEAEVYLADYSDWIALDDSVKTTHIYNASLYIQTVWTCVDVDWEVTEDIADEIKHACSLYALASSVGNLYGSPDTANSRKTTKESVKAGSVTVTEEFASSGSTTTGVAVSFGLPDALMSVNCTKAATTQGLLRN